MAVARTFLALLAGFVTMGLLLAVITALVNRLAPDWAGVESKPRPGYALVNLGYSFLSAAAGGYVTAYLARGNPLVLVLVLGVVVLAIAALSALQSRGAQPAWYALALLVLMPLGVLAGGLARLRVLGIL